MTNSFTVSPRSNEFGPSPRWVRVYFNNQLIAESRKMMLLREPDHLPVYFFPKEAVLMDCLRLSDRTKQSEYNGEGIYWHVQLGDRIEKNAAFTFRNGSGNGPNLEDYIAFKWEKMDAWFEEDEEVFVYARDPHKRIDILQSSRHIKVAVDGVTVGETKRPWLLFETGLPVRYYMPKQDANMDLLVRTDVTTLCPYKGKANLYSINIGNNLYEGLAWTYRYPTMECARIQGLVAFFNEKLDIYEDGILQPRPKTFWS